MSESVFEPRNIGLDTDQVESAIADLLEKDAIQECTDVVGQFLFPFFIVSKPSGGNRFILNLKRFNKKMITEHFKMKDIRTAKRLLKEGDFMASIDLYDAYFAIPVNYEKSALIPSQVCKFLGFELNSKEMMLYVPLKKKYEIKTLVKKFIKLKQCSIRQFASLIGLLVVISQAVRYAWLYIKRLERLRFIYLLRNKGCYDNKIVLSSSVIQDLVWWNNNIIRAENSIKQDFFDHVIFTDASTTGWGAVLEFTPWLSNSNILLRVDNVSAISYINKIGGVRYLELSEIARSIWQWAERHGVCLFASYIPSAENVTADMLSRVKNVDTEWELNSYYFSIIINEFGEPDIDLFATSSNPKCKTYCSRYPEQGALAVDAFTISWASINFYAFPPFAIILRVIRKMIDEKAQGIIVQRTSFGEKSSIISSDGIRDTFLRRGFDEGVLEVLLSSLANSTQQFKTGVSFNVINTHRAAISFVSDLDLNNNKLLSRFMKGVYRLRPSKPRYEEIWDISLVLNFVRKWFPLDMLSIQDLTQRTVMLLALVSGHRVQTLAAIKINNILLNEDNIIIRITDIVKTSGPGKLQPAFVLPWFKENPEICVANSLVEYMKVTSELRGNIQNLFVTYKKPYKPASAQTISRWIKEVLNKCGIDTQKFKAHSTRHASTSAAFTKGVDINVIKNTAGWSNTSDMFSKFYNRPVAVNKKDIFARAILEEL
ncbi:uncharacterized protein [Prorops nasuta]|uniref:uncharacterized protein n=1 Tax=Prorops nasuta TaxID=863751 RepID=UPI0034CDF24F